LPEEDWLLAREEGAGLGVVGPEVGPEVTQAPWEAQVVVVVVGAGWSLGVDIVSLVAAAAAAAAAAAYIDAAVERAAVDNWTSLAMRVLGMALHKYSCWLFHRPAAAAAAAAASASEVAAAVTLQLLGQRK